MSYTAPLKDMLFCMKELADLEAVARLPGFEDAGIETAQAVLEECARFSGEVLAPLNRDGDVHPSSWQAGVVTTTPGLLLLDIQMTRICWSMILSEKPVSTFPDHALVSSYVRAHIASSDFAVLNLV